MMFQLLLTAKKLAPFVYHEYNPLDSVIITVDSLSKFRDFEQLRTILYFWMK